MMLGRPKAWRWTNYIIGPEIATKGKGRLTDIQEGSLWQQGPLCISQPRETWPASRAFKRQLPEEKVKVAGVHATAGETLEAPVQRPGFLRFVEEVMQRHNDYRVAKAIIARWLTAMLTREREDIWKEPTLEYLQKAERTVLLSATIEVTAYI